jgi:hypothetical protein
VPRADLSRVRVVRVLGEPLLDRAPVQRLVAVPVVLRRRDDGDGPQRPGVHDRDRALERRERTVAELVVVRNRQRAEVRLADDDMAALAHRGLERIQRPGEAAPDEARAETHRHVVRARLELLLRSIAEPERDELRETGHPHALDGSRVELGCDLDALDPAAELLREQERGPAPARGDVEHARARVQPEPPAEKTELVLGDRVLELVIALRDGEVAREHGHILTRR